EDDLLWLQGDDEDAAVPDKDTDIKPRHYGGKAHGFERDANGDDGSQKRVGAYGEELDEGEDEDYDDLDDEDFADEMSTEWNLRKCAAAALDVLAVRFGADLLNVLLEPLKTKLWSDDWLQRESGILALGAMAEGPEPVTWESQGSESDRRSAGCIDAIEPHLPTLVPYLINTLNDPKLLRMVLDNNKRVQEAGCSAFATLEEDAGPELAPYLEPVLRSLVFAFEKYQNKNMLILYDAVGTLADAVGSALQNPTYVEILMPPLLKRWSKLKDDDHDLIPVLKCLASVTIAMGPAFLSYATPIFDRCHTIVHTSLLQYQAYQQNLEMDEPDRSFLVVALGLLSGLTQGLRTALESHISGSQPNLLELLIICLKHPHAAVRQSGYALVGDMAMNCFPLLRPQVSSIMQEIIAQLDPEPKVEFISACNNAAWAVGEIALQFGRDEADFQQWVHPLVSRLIPILLHSKAPRSLHENAAVSIGRIGLMHPALVAPRLPEFAEAWCKALNEISDNEEKDSAFRGFCTLVQMNLAGITKSLLWFCNAIGKWNRPSPELNDMFQQLLNELREHDSVCWKAHVVKISPVIQELLVTRYGG
ncbi:Transportin-2, partial [Trametes pubescens]